MPAQINNFTVIPVAPPEVTQAAQQGDYITGFPLAFTLLFMGIIFMLLVFTYIFLRIFGTPIHVAKSTSTSGKAIIQHFETSKSAAFKTSSITGGALRYDSIRDGTVAVSPKSIFNIKGKRLVITFAQFGVTIPFDILCAVSILLQEGITNITELKNYVNNGSRHFNIMKGYDFDNFSNLLHQTKTERLIPLVIEAVPEFVERNISADITEKKIIINEMLFTRTDEPSNEAIKYISIAIAIALILMVGMVIK